MLPITRVVLFQHGVGYFERSGTVEGNQTIELLFKADQMNDLLKSLTTIDLDGGSFSVLNYESEDPFERRLADINIEIPDKRAISSFLAQLKGTEVTVPRSSGELRGVIVGVENVNQKTGDTVTTEPHLAVLAEGCRLLRIPLLEAGEITFLDEVVASDLSKLLQIHHSNLHKNRKKLTIHADGQGSRRVVLSYVIEVPLWKTSYRLILPQDASEKPLLQGWALVDNTSEDDWEKVNLSLVSGMPVSFVHDLYSPRYRKRPTILPDLGAGASPVMIERRQKHEFPEEPVDALMEPSPSYAVREESLDLDMEDFESYDELDSPTQVIRQSVKAGANTRQMGDLFSYDVSRPVDVTRGSSALVPILQTEAAAESVLIYNPEGRAKNPMRAVYFKNTTQLTLEKGPITVIDSGCYAGEAMLDYTRKDEETFIPYSVELRVAVRQESSERRERFHHVRKRGKYLHKQYIQKRITTYSVHSQLDRSATLYLDHRFRYDLDDAAVVKPFEITDNYWRYKIELTAASDLDFSVTEIAQRYESIEVPDIAKEEILALHNNELISDAVRKALEQIADTAAKEARLVSELQEKQSLLNQIESGQKRLRENIKALGRSSEEAELRKKYVAKLTAEEEQIEKVKAEVKDLQKNIKTIRDEIAAMTQALRLK
jgi:hypothetical protein